MEMEHGFDFTQEQRPWVSPSLIEANYILSLSRMELESIIAAEVEVNPALELDEQPICATCGSVLEGAVCPICPVEAPASDEPDRDDSIAERLTSASSLRESDDFDPLALVADDENVRSTILRDAHTILEPAEQAIAEYLVDAIDERGFLAASLDEIAAALAVDAAAVESVLEVVQDVAPVGVGARDLRECLLLQIRELENVGQVVPPTVHAIVDRHLADLALHKFGKISKELGVSTDEVEAARDYIRAHLNPTPLQSHLARSWRSPSRSTYVAPDVIISIKDDALLVEVLDSGRARLRLNPLYEELSVKLSRHRSHREPNAGGDQEQAHSATTETTDQDRTHIRQYTARAKNFLSNVQQRQDTLLRITKCICELQEHFLRDGVRELRPLTRATVAQQVGVHESTVSRATADKYVMLPTRKVIPFSDFFTPSLSVKDVMRELIHHEHTNGRSLTDREICDRLQREGIRIARRTVAKYRNELGILPSTMR